MKTGWLIIGHLLLLMMMLILLMQVSNPTLEEAIRGFRVIKNDTLELVFDKPGTYTVPEPAAAAAAEEAPAASKAAPAASPEDEAAAAAAAVTAKAFEAVLTGAHV
jgi:hypothetical protein